MSFIYSSFTYWQMYPSTDSWPSLVSSHLPSSNLKRTWSCLSLSGFLLSHDSKDHFDPSLHSHVSSDFCAPIQAQPLLSTFFLSFLTPDMLDYCAFTQRSCAQYRNKLRPACRSEWPSEWVTKWPSDQVTKWPCDQVTKWPSDQVAKWPSGRVTEWPSDQVTKWLSDQVTKWPSDQVTGSFTDDLPYGIFSYHRLTPQKIVQILWIVSEI